MLNVKENSSESNTETMSSLIPTLKEMEILEKESKPLTRSLEEEAEEEEDQEGMFNPLF